MMRTIGSFFSGVGGLELGLEMAGVGKSVFQVELDPYCRQVLARHWPGATRHDDITTFVAHPGQVDVMCGGFPCQDVSLAGKGAGLTGARSGLWFEFKKRIEEGCPRVVVIENVPGLVRRGLDVVVSDLTGLGYEVEASRIRASDVGATHRRERLFILAYALGQGQPQSEGGEQQGRRRPIHSSEEVANPNGERRHQGFRRQDVGNAGQGGVAHSNRIDLREQQGRECRTYGTHPAQLDSDGEAVEHTEGERRSERTGERLPPVPSHGTPEPTLGRVPYGLPNWMDRDKWPLPPGPRQHAWEPSRTVPPRSVSHRPARVKALGNAVVWQCAYIAGMRVMQRMGW